MQPGARHHGEHRSCSKLEFKSKLNSLPELPLQTPDGVPGTLQPMSRGLSMSSPDLDLQHSFTVSNSLRYNGDDDHGSAFCRNLELLQCSKSLSTLTSGRKPRRIFTLNSFCYSCLKPCKNIRAFWCIHGVFSQILLCLTSRFTACSRVMLVDSLNGLKPEQCECIRRSFRNPEQAQIRTDIHWILQAWSWHSRWLLKSMDP